MKKILLSLILSLVAFGAFSAPGDVRVQRKPLNGASFFDDIMLTEPTSISFLMYNSVTRLPQFYVAGSGFVCDSGVCTVSTTIGPDGKSAYQVAQNNGFAGTEPQWLLTLKGADGAPGATGSAGSNGTNGANGANGADSTVAGPTGLTGPAGIQGPSGANGTNGATGSVGATGATGSTGAKGDKGDTGDAGAASTVAGPTGPQGATGATGSPGTTSYLGLSNLPTLFSGAYADLTGKPSLFNGAYSSLSGAPNVGRAVLETTEKTLSFRVYKSVTVASGVAVFNLTADGLSTGTALFSEPYTDSVQVSVNDALASYQFSWAFSNSNKTLTVTTNKLTTSNILTGILGQSAANGAVVKLAVEGR